MTSRHRTRTTHAQRTEDVPAWTSSEPEAGHSRQAMTSTQRHNTEQANGDGHRKHRSKRAETTDAVAPSAPVTSHSKSSSKHRSSTMPSTSYQGAYPSTHAMAGGVPVSMASPAATAPYYAGDTSRSHGKARADKPSPRSSNERVTLPDDKSARHARTAYPTMATVQAPSSTQYYVDHAPVAGETSSRHRRERDRERNKERERERRREEKARARTQEAESLRTKEKERDRERRKEREREAERASRDRDGHRSTERTKEHERSRRKEERRAAERAAAQATIPSTEAYRPSEVGDRHTTSSVRSPVQLRTYIQYTDAGLRPDMPRRTDSPPTRRRSRRRSQVAMLCQGRLLTITTRRSPQQPTVDRRTQHPRLWQCHCAAPSVTRARRANTGHTAIGRQVKAVVKNQGCRAVSKSGPCMGA